MCGRFTLATPSSALAGRFGLSALSELTPRYNVAPTQPVAAVRANAEGNPSFASLRWGLIPPWAKDLSIGARMINARAETVAEKPSFRSAFRHRRCLVLADGYYEWCKTIDGKQPYWIRTAEGGPFAFAGLWERYEQAGAEVIESCTIITTLPIPQLPEIHDRMPVILPAAAYRTWLDTAYSDLKVLQRHLRPFTEQAMTATRVSTWVNNAGHDDPRCIQALN